MRLGQLARQLDVKTDDIVKFLEKEKSVNIKSHPNSKVEDDLIEDISNHFKPEPVEDSKDIAETVEEKIEEQPKEEVIEAKKVDTEEIPANPEHIETPKTELDGPKVVGKIDLPNKKDIQVEIDGVVYDQEFLDKKKKDELAELRKQKQLEKEEKKKEEAEKKRIALEKKKIEAERQAMLAQEENNALSAEEEKKKEVIRKAQEERERKLEEKRKKRQKEHYASKHAVKHAPKKKKKKTTTEEVEEIEEAQQPQETNPIKKFIKWLNT